MRLWVQLHLEGSKQSSFRLVDIGLGIGLRRMYGFFFLTYFFLLTFLICSLHTILSFVLKNIPSVPNGKDFKVIEWLDQYQENRLRFSGVWFRPVWYVFTGLLPVYYYLKNRHSADTHIQTTRRHFLKHSHSHSLLLQENSHAWIPYSYHVRVSHLEWSNWLDKKMKEQTIFRNVGFANPNKQLHITEDLNMHLCIPLGWIWRLRGV